MANTLLSLLVKLGLDSSEYDKGLDNAQKSAGGLQSKLAMVGGALVGGGIAAAGAGVVALGGFLASTVSPASDLNESINAVNVVFGEGAKAMLDYGKTAAETVGLSNSEFNKMATTTGAFLQNVGFNADTAGQETIKLTERAADMASVFNTDVVDAMAAIQSGLKGEFNPLEQFGVKLNAAQIEARALEMGLADADGKLTDSAKSTAALSLIYEQTAKTAGDFSNTSGELANQQRILSARFKDIQAKIGTALLPLMTKLGAAISDLLANPAFQAGLDNFIVGLTGLVNVVITNFPLVLQWFQNAFGWLQNNQGVIVGVLAALGAAIAVFVFTTVIPALGSFIAAAAPVILVMALIGGAAYLLYQAWTTNFGGIQEKAAAVWAWLQPIFEDIKAWLAAKIPVAIQALTDFWNNTLLPALVNVWGWVQDTLFPLFATWGAWLAENLPVAMAALVDFWTGVLHPALIAVWGWIQGTLFPLLSTWWDWLSTNIPAAITTLVGFWRDVLHPALLKVWDWMDTVLFPFFQDLSDLFTAVVGLAVTALAALWTNVLLPALTDVWSFISTNLQPVFDTLVEFFDTSVKPIVTAAASWFGEKLAGGIDSVTAAIMNAMTWLK